MLRSTLLLRNVFNRHFSSKINTDDLLRGILQEKRGDLARSITLIETTNAEKKVHAQILLNKVLAHLKQQNANKLRIGITGPPGAGKSSLIEAFGKHLTTTVGIKVAVLTIDPSSTTTGGSILGDKVRMHELARDPKAYIRTSPNKLHLGGVTRTTLESIFLCEAANYDVILVETVGVGQAEHAIENMVDCMLLLVPPGSGDELQGLKKGIAEMADLVVVTKYDGNLEKDAIRVKSEYLSALKFIRKKSKHWRPKVLLTSSLTNKGIGELWSTLDEFHKKMFDCGAMQERRQKQLKLWFWTHIRDNLLELFLSKEQLKQKLEKLELSVIKGEITPGQASDILQKDFEKLVN